MAAWSLPSGEGSGFGETHCSCVSDGMPPQRDVAATSTKASAVETSLRSVGDQEKVLRAHNAH